TKVFELLVRIGNWGVFISAIGIFPTEIVIAILAASKEYSLWSIAFASAAGEFVGAFPTYLVGKIFSGKNINKWLDGKGKFLQINEKRFEKSSEQIVKYGHIYIFFSRFVPYLRVVSGVAAGFLEINVFFFSASVFLGSYVYSLLIAYMGLMVGGDLETIKRYVNLFNKWILAIIILYFGIKIFIKYRKEIFKYLKTLKKYFQ
ncbi:hypothetical protein GX618_00480, partial [Candidatus Dojkabacteria bacterium]|nr:hypothetical protein [Candidatus Dojkabacteria bacterium]